MSLQILLLRNWSKEICMTLYTKELLRHLEEFAIFVLAEFRYASFMWFVYLNSYLVSLLKTFLCLCYSYIKFNVLIMGFCSKFGKTLAKLRSILQIVTQL